MDEDDLKELKQRNIITEESYIERVVDFAKVYMEKDMKLEILRLLPRGTYGGKIIAKEKGSRVEIEAKIVISEKCPKQYIDVWPSLKHSNIVRLLDMKDLHNRCDAYIFITENYLYNLEEYLLPDMISQKPDSPKIVKNLLRDILQGLAYLHGRGYSHLALKAENILISSDNKAIISNFGSLSTTKEIPKSKEIPLNYGLPELYYRKNYNVDVCGDCYDVWCFGILALNIFTSYMQKKNLEHSDWHDNVYPFLFRILQERKFSQRIDKVFRASEIKKKERTVMIDFIITCLRINPLVRPSPNTLLEHKYITENGGFMTVNRGLWKRELEAKIYDFICCGCTIYYEPPPKADFWIEILHCSNKSIAKETVNENETLSYKL